jgi:hypothetical protein
MKKQAFSLLICFEAAHLGAIQAFRTAGTDLGALLCFVFPFFFFMIMFVLFFQRRERTLF